MTSSKGLNKMMRKKRYKLYGKTYSFAMRITSRRVDSIFVVVIACTFSVCEKTEREAKILSEVLHGVMMHLWQE